jgi:integrase
LKLTGAKVRALRPREKAYQVADGGGLFADVLPTGRVVWRLRYRLPGEPRQEKATLGPYPVHSLADARQWRELCKRQISQGVSPAAEKRQRSAEVHHSVEELAKRWLREVVEPARKDANTVRRVLEKDVLPVIGSRRVDEVTVADVLRVVDRVKARGADMMALQTHGTVRRLLDYGMGRQLIQVNPAAAVQSRYVGTPKPRSRVLSLDEVGQLLRALYASDLKRSRILVIHLLLLTWARKGELTAAQWSEFDLEAALWAIPAERMKKSRPHLVPLSDQAVSILGELRERCDGSEWILPSNRSRGRRPLAHNTLNKALAALSLTLPSFVIHDFRRTASTHAHEAGFSSDVVEKALAHEQGGVRAIYNRAEYLDQRRELFRWWSDLVDTHAGGCGNVVVIGGRAHGE